MIESFQDELFKVGSAKALGAMMRAAGKRLKKAKKAADKHPLKDPVTSAATLGAGVGATQEYIKSDDPRLIRAALAGGAGGALTGRMFPGWFTRANRLAGKHKGG